MTTARALVGYAVIGSGVAVCARLVIPGSDLAGLIAAAGIGLAGGVLGGVVGRMLLT